MPQTLSIGGRPGARLRSTSLFLLPLAIAAGAALTGCESGGAPRGFENRFSLDGSVDEWPGSRVAIASPRYIYLRFSIEEEVASAAGADATTHLMLDIDSNSATGRRLGSAAIFNEFGGSVPAEIANMGVDIEVQLTPPGGAGPNTLPPRVRLVGYEVDGTPVDLNNSDIGFQFAPNHASDWYEVRIDRWGATDWPLAQPARVSGVFLTVSNDGLLGASEAFEFRMPSGAEQPPEPAAQTGESTGWPQPAGDAPADPAA